MNINVKPGHTSTPKTYSTVRRRGIHDEYSVPSPILGETIRAEYNTNQPIDEPKFHEEYSEDSDAEYDDNKEYSCERTNKSVSQNSYSNRSVERSIQISKSTPTKSINSVHMEQSSVKCYICVLVVLIAAPVIYVMGIQKSETNEIVCQLNELPNQNKELSVMVEVSVNEILNFDKPSVILFIYKDKAGIMKILKEISQYASCMLQSKKDPIFMNPQDFNIESYMQDYGQAIHDIKPRLEVSNVLVVEDIDNIEGTVAQAFHSLCDEYTPLLPHSLFLFTIKGSPRTKYSNFVNERLHNKWSAIDEDKIEPLLTRITSVIAEII